MAELPVRPGKDSARGLRCVSQVKSFEAYTVALGGTIARYDRGNRRSRVYWLKLYFELDCRFWNAGDQPGPVDVSRQPGEHGGARRRRPL